MRKNRDFHVEECKDEAIKLGKVLGLETERLGFLKLFKALEVLKDWTQEKQQDI